jgi:phage gpG-like protein
MSKRFNIAEQEQHFKRVLSYAPGMLGNTAVNFFLDRFRGQNWIGSTTEPWRKRKINNKQSQGRALLIKSGRLRRSIRITRISGLTVVIGTDVPYAKAHNEGFRGTVKVAAFTRHKYSKHSVGSGKFNKSGSERMKTVQKFSGDIQVKAHTRRVNLPRRQFMGYSPYLEKQLQRQLLNELIKSIRT